jgi:hypothetical protein
MIEGLATALEECPHDGVTELRAVLQDVLSGSGRLLDEQPLKKTCNVYRLTFDGPPRTVVVKCLTLPRAVRNEMVASRWLPAADLAHRGPVLLGVAAQRSAKAVWHVYEDFGDEVLSTGEPASTQVGAAIDLIAELHLRFAEHPLLPEARMYGKDMGMGYFLTNVRDAIRGLESLAADADPGREALRDRLLRRLIKLYDEGPERMRVMAEAGGPETLLHGDLWPKNILTAPTPKGPQSRLIDWDATGVGPVTYDLSTFLYRFPVDQRPSLLARYRAAAEPLGWETPATRDLSLLLETAEISRIANCLVWPCIAAVQDQADWTWDSLAEMETWFDAVEPALDA